MTTIKEVAQRARCSVATVSRVINKTGFVSPDLVNRVEAAMRDLHYQPSDLARGLRSQRTMAVGVLIPQLDQPFFSALTFAIERTLSSQHYHALICSAEENLDNETAHVDMFLRQRVDGVIVVPTGQSGDNVLRLRERSVPVVIVDRDLPTLQGVHRVLSDNHRGGYEGMQYLMELGHTRIGVISGPEHSEPMNHRLRGLRQALRDRDVHLDATLFVSSDLQQFDMGYSAGNHLLDLPEPPTAIFALTDVMAVGAIHAAAKRGWRLPDDLSVIGFDNIPLASYIIPELTTIAQPIQAMGECASRTLLDALNDLSLPAQTTLLSTELVVRQSARPWRQT
jgi:LacI family transcriptional regulator